MPFHFFAGLAVLLLQLQFFAEGAEWACPMIGNFTSKVVPISDPFSNQEPKETLIILSVFFHEVEQSACECNVHKVIRGRLRLKAKVKKCEHHGPD